MFEDRTQAATLLAAKLQRFAHKPDVIVLGLPRGGAPMARIVADALHAPCDVCLVRKLGAPSQPELALGALAEGGIRLIDHALAESLDVTDADLERITRLAQLEIDRRSAAYRGHHDPPTVEGRTVIIVDDGLATGSTMIAAIRAIRKRGAAHIIAAIPVAPPSTCHRLEREADEVVCLETHEPFYSVGSWYRDFHQLEDADVIAALTPRSETTAE